MKHMRMGHMMIRPKAIGKRMQPKKLGIRIKFTTIGEVVEYIRMAYESIKHGSAK